MRTVKGALKERDVGERLCKRNNLAYSWRDVTVWPHACTSTCGVFIRIPVHTCWVKAFHITPNYV